MKAYIRTVKSGVVRVDGVDYTPSEEYVGQLDGLRLVFAKYTSAFDGSTFLSLWGSEALYRGQAFTEDEPNLIGGQFCWVWWSPVKDQQQEEV